MKKYNQYVMPAACLIAALVIWEGCVQLFDISSYILPAPTAIAKAMVSEFGELWAHSMVTLKEAVIGLVIAALFLAMLLLTH